MTISDFERKFDEAFAETVSNHRRANVQLRAEYGRRENGRDPEDAPPPIGPDEYGVEGVGAADKGSRLPEMLPLSLAQWEARQLADPDFLLGSMLSTTTRSLMIAPTGQGKTMFAIGLGFAVAAGTDFLHWKGRGESARVLYIDGEMSARLLRARLQTAEAHFGSSPETFFALSHEDIPGFAPLNTPAGQACIEAVIERLGHVDFVIFDSVMCLTLGDMKEEESWGQTLPWVRKLTSRAVGQLWIHHTGHDETKGYGTKTREWQLDLVLLMEPFKREGVDISFNLTFRKARERTPENRADFQDLKIALVLGKWEADMPQPTKRPGRCSPAALKALDALHSVLAEADKVRPVNGCSAVHNDAWKAECGRRGLVDLEKATSATALFNRFRRELVGADRVACDGKWTWMLQ